MKKLNLLSVTAACLLLASCGDPVFEVERGARAEEVQDALEDVLDSYDDEDRFRVMSYLSRGEHFRDSLGLTASQILARANDEYYESVKKSSGGFLSLAMNMFENSAGSDCGSPYGYDTSEQEDKAQRFPINEPRHRKENELFGKISYSYELNPAKRDRLLLTLKNDSDLLVTQISLAGRGVWTGKLRIEEGIQPGEEATVELTYYTGSGVTLKNGDWLQIKEIVFKDDALNETFDIVPYQGNIYRIFVGDRNDLIYEKIRKENREKFFKSDRIKDFIGTDACAGYDEYTEKVKNKLAELTAGMRPAESGGGTFGR